MNNTIRCQNFHMLIQNFAIDDLSSDRWDPKMWKFSHSRFTFVASFNNCFAAHQTFFKFGWIFQWDWYILNGCHNASLFITNITTGSWDVMNRLRCLLPFIIKFPISFGKFGSNTWTENTARYKSIWISKFLKLNKKIIENNEAIWGYDLLAKHIFIYQSLSCHCHRLIETEKWWWPQWNANSVSDWISKKYQNKSNIK